MDFTLAGGGGEVRLAELSLAQDSAPLRELQALAAAAGRERGEFSREQQLSTAHPRAVASDTVCC